MWIFLGVAYGLSIVLSAVVGLTGGHESELVGLGITAMAFPAMAVLVVKWGAKDPVKDAGWRRFPVRWFPIALLLMPLYVHAVSLPVLGALGEGGLPWVAWLTPSADGLFHPPEERGWGVLTHGALAGRILLNLVVGLLIMSVFALLEEIGWRAWLLPRLLERTGERTAVLSSAVIWAFWHTPFALGGLHHLKHINLPTLLLVLPLGHIGLGIVLGWLWLRTRSIWMVTLAHASMNNWGQYAYKYMAFDPDLELPMFICVQVSVLAMGAFILWGVRPARET